MKTYQSHKIVQAASIISTSSSTPTSVNPRGGLILYLDDGQKIDVSGKARFDMAESGGYYVLYSDNYASFSPKEAFESGYVVVPPADVAGASEAEIQASRNTAPRITLADIEANIVSEHYINAGDACIGPVRHSGNGDAGRSLDMLTFCVLTLKNGFTVTGESACASPENFDADTGRQIARENAVSKVWPLLGFALKNDLHRRALFATEQKIGNNL